MLTNCLAACAHLSITVSEIQRDIYETIGILLYLLAFDPPLVGFQSGYRHPLWHGKTRMVSLPDGEKISKISLFVLAQLRNVTEPPPQDPRFRGALPPNPLPGALPLDPAGGLPSPDPLLGYSPPTSVSGAATAPFHSARRPCYSRNIAIPFGMEWYGKNLEYRRRCDCLAVPRRLQMGYSTYLTYLPTVM